AVEIAGSALNRRILNFGFRLDWRREIERRAEPDYATTLSLDQEDFASKLAAARGYTELAPEVDSALNNNGAEAFRLERLIPIRAAGGSHPGSRPYYEEYGEGLVAAGVYDQVIRYHEHLAPLAKALSSTIPGSG